MSETDEEFEASDLTHPGMTIKNDKGRPILSFKKKESAAGPYYIYQVIWDNVDSKARIKIKEKILPNVKRFGQMTGIPFFDFDEIMSKIAILRSKTDDMFDISKKLTIIVTDQVTGNLHEIQIGVTGSYTPRVDFGIGRKDAIR